MPRQISKERLDQLINVQWQLDHLNDSIQKIIDGKSSMVEFARNFNLDQRRLNACVSKGLYTLAKKIKILDSKDIEQLLRDSASPAEKLINAILKPKHKYIILDTAEEVAVLKIMKEALTDIEYEIIVSRFGFNGESLRYQKLGPKYNVTPTRISQIEQIALGKLRNPKYLKELLPNYALKIKELHETQEMVAIIKQIDNEIKLAKDGKVYYNIPIRELNLSTRSHNALVLNKIYTIGQLSKLTSDDLAKIKNVGAKSFKEITEKLKTQYGIILEDDLGILMR